MISKQHKPNNKVGLLFTGGLDSTYILYMLAESRKYDVTLYYSEIKNNIIKTKMELQSIERIMTYFKNNYKNMDLELIVNSVEVSSYNSLTIFPQLPVHLLTLLYANKNLESLYIGYTMNDDFVSYINDLERTWETLKNFMPDDNKPNLVFPLLKIPKYQMIDNLSLDLLKLLRSCENPIELDNDFQPCGSCTVCRRYNYIKSSSMCNVPDNLTGKTVLNPFDLEKSKFKNLDDDDIMEEEF